MVDEFANGRLDPKAFPPIARLLSLVLSVAIIGGILVSVVADVARAA